MHPRIPSPPRSTLDWDDLRVFLAVAREGTMSAAARALAVAQPTVGRRIGALERRLGARLLDRGHAGHTLTAAGRRMLASAERIEAEALAAQRAAAGRDAGLDGVVRVTASEWLAVRVIGPALAPLLAAHPGLAVEIVADARHLDLVRREADLALRPSRFTHAAIHQRRLADAPFALYASEAYLARHGTPDVARQCVGHVILAMDEALGDVARAWIASAAARARVAIRTNGREAMATMAAAGAGLACLPTVVGDATSGLRRVTVAAAPPRPTLWLGVHRDVRAIPRVRAVIDQLVREAPARLR